MTTDVFTNPARFGDLTGWHREIDALRAEAPIHRVDLRDRGYTPFWAVLTHRDVMDVERRSKVFTNDPQTVLFTDQANRDRASSGTNIRTLVNMDGAEHIAHRGLTSDHFKPATLDRLQPRLDELSRELLNRMEASAGACDFARDVSVWFPLAVILQLFGLATDDYPTILNFSQKLFGAEDPDVTGTSTDFNHVVLEMLSYFEALTADRRRSPRDDLASLIANADIDGNPLPDLVTIGYYIIFVTAGHDTTSSAMTVGVEALARHPDQLAELQRDPTLIPRAVDEMIRLATPVRHFLRTAQEDTQIAGVDIAKGDRIYLSYLAANRDPELFDRPHEFDIHRANSDKHVAFGFGPHFCLGAQLAKMELRTVFSDLVPRLEHLELAADPITTKATFVGGPRTLPIRYRLTPAK